ncbi:SH3 domain-containing protein [Pelotomaculum terephthalicicum JT]|uniref:SH3 domain-containing protein n=1 Tax=Pelotomaculum TaxID=191373 RepID=UPI0009CA8AA3|nr:MULTISPECIES: SH3 domain-containing protein [Pelotomaculum]MCG9969098.1 SH3 domain-containing protein [Pelotomaculum terephthalicicum JT]OPX86102.1 MAG: Bacterial SH3 domain protein [Pelotomaculum sp. PtaB.Bin117]OPY60145.1 MAG: Bacterial SH3 domain protein [Pelotomaculum sp. PtaU1.Bin065]
MTFIWLWALVASAVIAGVFLIITLARIEAGAGGRSKWLAFTFCSLAVVSGLIIFKPRQNAEQVQYMPAPASVENQVNESRSAAPQKSVAEPTGSSSGLAGGVKSNSAVDENQDAQETRDSAGDAPIEAQKVFDLADYRDPVLEEILFLKRQAGEIKEGTGSMEALEETSADKVSDTASPKQSEQQLDDSNYHQSGEQQFSEGQTEQQKSQIQRVVKGKVLATSLNVRDKGDLNGRIIGTLKSGDSIEVFVEPETGEWCKVKLNSGQTGWTMKKYISIEP